MITELCSICNNELEVTILTCNPPITRYYCPICKIEKLDKHDRIEVIIEMPLISESDIYEEFRDEIKGPWNNWGEE